MTARFGPPYMDWRDLDKVIRHADAFAADLLVIKVEGLDHYNCVPFDWLEDGASAFLLNGKKHIVLWVSPKSSAADVRFYPEDA